jgi:hypothetical protein
MLNDPKGWMAAHNVRQQEWSMGAVGHVIETCFPELARRGDFYSQWVKDLQAEGLVGAGSFLNTMMTGHGMTESRTTEMGKKFLSYISR